MHSFCISIILYFSWILKTSYINFLHFNLMSWNNSSCLTLKKMKSQVRAGSRKADHYHFLHLPRETRKYYYRTPNVFSKTCLKWSIFPKRELNDNSNNNNERNKIFIYLLATFIVQNLKKKFRTDPELWRRAIFEPKMTHLPWTLFL